MRTAPVHYIKYYLKVYVSDSFVTSLGIVDVIKKILLACKYQTFVFEARMK